MEFPARFKLEYWYHVFVFLGAAGAAAALTVEIKGISNAHAVLLSLGMFFVGIGEWINHPLRTEIVPPNAYYAPTGGMLTGHPRHNSPTGVGFAVVGVILLCIGLLKVVAAA